MIRINTLLNFPKFYNLIKDKLLPIPTAYRLAKLSAAINDELSFYQNEFVSIVNKYAELDENGKPVFINNGETIKIKEESKEECAKRISELDTLEVDLSDFSFSIDEFKDFELSIEQLEPIMPFIKD